MKNIDHSKLEIEVGINSVQTLNERRIVIIEISNEKRIKMLYFQNIASNRIYFVRKSVILIGRSLQADILLDNIHVGNCEAKVITINARGIRAYLIRNYSSRNINVTTDAGGFILEPNDIFELKPNDFIEFGGGVVYKLLEELPTIDLTDDEGSLERWD